MRSPFRRPKIRDDSHGISEMESEPILWWALYLTEMKCSKPKRQLILSPEDFRNRKP